MAFRDSKNALQLKKFGERLRKLRLERNLTQEEVAGLTGFSRSYYTQLETGKRNIALLNLFRLAESLQISVKDLVDFSDND